MNLNLIKQITIGKKFAYWCALIVLVAFHIVFGLKTVSLGSQLSQLEKDEKHLKAEMKDLSSELVKVTSLTKLSENSEDLGFVKPSSTMYLNETEFVASLRN